MDLSSDQIVTSLIAFYRRNGVDLTYLLGDPTFQSLKVKEKIEAIKDHAAELHAGSQDRLTRQEKKRALVDSAFEALPVIPATIALARSDFARELVPALQKVHRPSVALAATGGLAAAAGIAGFRAWMSLHQDVANRKAIRQQLANAAENPGHDSAIGVLAASNIHRLNSGHVASLISRAHSILDGHSPTANMASDYKNHFNNRLRAAGIGDEYRVPKNFQI